MDTTAIFDERTRLASREEQIKTKIKRLNSLRNKARVDLASVRKEMSRLSREIGQDPGVPPPKEKISSKHIAEKGQHEIAPV